MTKSLSSTGTVRAHHCRPRELRIGNAKRSNPESRHLSAVAGGGRKQGRAARLRRGRTIYRWNGTSWTFIAPDAQLFPDDDAQTQVFGIHYAGPTWESKSGSSVRGALDDLCVPDPNALPWLRLRAVSSEGPGLFLGTAFIQRLNTVGGLAPAFSGSVVGQEVRVPYTADYYFYKARP